MGYLHVTLAWMRQWSARAGTQGRFGGSRALLSCEELGDAGPDRHGEDPLLAPLGGATALVAATCWCRAAGQSVAALLAELPRRPPGLARPCGLGPIASLFTSDGLCGCLWQELRGPGEARASRSPFLHLLFARGSSAAAGPPRNLLQRGYTGLPCASVPADALWQTFRRRNEPRATKGT